MTYAGNSSSHSSVERAVDASEYAFEPKDVKSQKKSVVPTRVSPTEADIKDRISRLYGCLADKELTARLPDNGVRIQEKIVELEKELDIIGMEKKIKHEIKDEIMDFDDVKSQKKSAVPTRVGPTEADIKDRISRLYRCLADKELTSRLPDNGLAIQEKIAELQKELEIIGMEKKIKDEIIDFDDVKSQKKSVVPTRVGPTEADIKDRINRLYGCLADKELTARLPDNGLAIQEKIVELQKELDIIGMKKEIKDER